MELRGLKTVESQLSDLDVFEAFRIMQEINTLKSKLEKLLKGNKTQVGLKSLVEAGFKPNQLVLRGEVFDIVRNEIKVGPKSVPGYSYWNYKMVVK